VHRSKTATLSTTPSAQAGTSPLVMVWTINP